MRTLLAQTTSRFAHLTGFGRKKAKAEDDKDKKDEKSKAAKAADDEDEDEDEERAEDDTDRKEASAEDDSEGEGDDEDEDKEKSKKGKKAASDEDEEKCEDDDDKEKAAVKRGRRMERARWGAVMSSKAAARNVQLAVTLLADTNKPSAHIIARLKDAAPSASSERSAHNPRIDTGSDAPTRRDQIEASWDTAIKRAAGGRK